MSTIFDPILTDAGQAAAFLASNDGVELQLTHVSFGTAHYDPNGSEEALLAEVSGKLPIAGGSRPTVSQIRMTSVWRADTGTFAIGEVAFWAGEVLAFIWSKAAGDVVGYKTPGVDFVLFNDLSFTQVPAGSISIVIDPDASVALAALAAHEGADNAHPQYVRYDVFPAAQKNLWAKTVAGTANALVITMQDGVHVDAYENGLMIRFKAASQSTGIATVNIDGKGVVSIKKGGGQPLDPGDIRAGGIYELVFDTDHFELAGGVGGSGFFQKFQSIATAGQTEFSASYSPGSILVFQNGRELGDSSYVATDGLKVTLNVSATAGDDVLIVAFTAFTVADSYTKAEAAQKDSPALTGNPTAPTPAQFDNDGSLATTEFVQRAKGNFRTFSGLVSGAAINASNIGGAYQPAEGGSVLFPTPLSIGAPAGASVTISMLGRTAATIQGVGGATFATNVNGLTSISLLKGQYIIVSAISSTEWAVLNHVKYDDSFLSSLAANGYQKLPSGMILQWGSGVFADKAVLTFPIAFLSACYSVVVTDGTILSQPASDVASYGIAPDSLTATNVSIRSSLGAAAGNTFWTAYGK